MLHDAAFQAEQDLAIERRAAAAERARIRQMALDEAEEIDRRAEGTLDVLGSSRISTALRDFAVLLEDS